MKDSESYRTRILTYLQQRFGDDLIALVLFGSRLRQASRAFSDIDVLVILNDAPREFRKRRQLAASIRRQLALPVDATLLGEETFKQSVQNCTPLMIELACAYEIWFEKKGFFTRHIQFMHTLVQQEKLIQLQPGVWKLVENLDEMAADGVSLST